VESAELLGAPRSFHGCGVLGLELLVVLRRKDMQDLDRIIGITVVCQLRGHLCPSFFRSHGPA
jgi:hypothetical protein